MSRHEQAVLDTSVLIDFATIDQAALPLTGAIAAVTLAELTAGQFTTGDAAERARRLQRLQWVEGTFEALPFDVAAARAYGRVYAATILAGQKPRSRAIDLLIAATALSRGLPLYTRNLADFRAVADLMEIIAV